MAVLIWAVMVGVPVLSDDPKSIMVRLWGHAPWGIPVKAVVAIVTTLLCVPAPWFCQHAVRIWLQLAKDGRSMSKANMLLALFTIGQEHPQLRRSAYIAASGLGYWILLLAAWIVYADAHGV